MSYNYRNTYNSENESESESENDIDVIMEQDDEIFRGLARNLDVEFSYTETDSDHEDELETITYTPNFLFIRSHQRAIFPEMNELIDLSLSGVSVFIVEQTVHSKELEAKLPTKHSDCPICLDSFEEKYCVTTNCDHIVCKSCMVQHLNSFKQRNAKPTCALCRTPYSCLQTLDVDTFDAVQQLLNN
jgi:hypothetical protein